MAVTGLQRRADVCSHGWIRGMELMCDAHDITKAPFRCKTQLRTTGQGTALSALDVDFCGSSAVCCWQHISVDMRSSPSRQFEDHSLRFISTKQRKTLFFVHPWSRMDIAAGILESCRDSNQPEPAAKRIARERMMLVFKLHDASCGQHRFQAARCVPLSSF